MDPNPDILSKLIAGGSGSAIAAWMARVTGLDLLFTFLGGLSAAWYFGPPVSSYFSLVSKESEFAVGWAIGFFAIFTLRKAYLVFEAVSAKDIVKYLKGFLPKKGG